VEGDLPAIGRSTLPGTTMRRKDLGFQQSRILQGQIYATYIVLVFNLNWREYRKGEGD